MPTTLCGAKNTRQQNQIVKRKINVTRKIEFIDQ